MAPVIHPEIRPNGSPSLRTITAALVAAFAAYAALGVFVTYPLIRHVSSRLPKDLGDPLIVTSILWWNATVMPLTDQWWNGFGFFPAPGMMAFSAHLLGASLIAAPLQWAGLGPVAAYNVTFLASFPLCGAAAYALAFTLTRRHDAAFVCGLAYAFNPYRVAHVEHLELLLAFGMPMALAALHLYGATRRAIWLAVLTAALVLQALSSSYYALFFTVVFGLWMAWFMRPRAWREALAVMAAGAAAVLVVSPIVLGYARIHRGYQMARDYAEVLQFSADLSSLVTASPLSAVWGWTAVLNGGERQLFPGLTITMLGIGGVVLLRRSRPDTADRLTVASGVAWGLSAVFAGLAITAWLAGPWLVEWGPLSVSMSAGYKPLSLAVAFAAAAIALGRTAREAFRTRSALAFYLAAAALLFVCSLGPRPEFLGERILYEPPYAWLMRLPFFDDTVRVPSRFAMPAVLALSVAASLAFSRMASIERRRTAVFAVVVAGILADGWIGSLPLAAAPQAGYRLPEGVKPAAVLELPLGDVWRDTEALFRATLHRTPTINGYNGYEPPYYPVLRRALEDGDATVLDALRTVGPIVVAADRDADPDGRWDALLSGHPATSRLGVDGRWTLFLLPPAPAAPPAQRCAPAPIAIAAAFDDRGRVDAGLLRDGNPATWWITPHPQRAGDTLTLDLGHAQPLCQVWLSMGSSPALYPGVLAVATSVDEVRWETRAGAAIGGAALRAALDDPADVRIPVAVEGQARFIRLRIERSQPSYPWAVAEVVVDGAAR